ncbi:MAG: hypothetical protein HY692_02775 [Cyanobacteria bacterium NC_groundwater_1444_Ag_S-0.65um_54_12]|nr:hypothetical protein [Cyanobacteria bacterium NC_groundwater_1444_Ag_S-0.65um_54_12]
MVSKVGARQADLQKKTRPLVEGMPDQKANEKIPPTTKLASDELSLRQYDYLNLAETSEDLDIADDADLLISAKSVPTEPVDDNSTVKADLKPIFQEIRELLGKNVKFTSAKAAGSKNPKPLWTVGEAKKLLAVVSAMPEKDRAALAKANFERIDELPHKDRDDGFGTEPDNGRISFQSGNPGGPLKIQLANIASENGVLTEVLTHEIGHAVQGGGRWDANAIREFGKLSHWTEIGPPEALVDGYSPTHRTLDFEKAYPQNASNFVNDYAAKSAVEDFAESYRHYLQDPATLLARAPEKFLYINAASGKYSITRVQELAAAAGVDLVLTMATLRKSSLRADTLERIAKAHLLLGAGDAGTGAGDAIALIQSRYDDAEFVSKLQQDPRSALGDDIWNRLSVAEQGLLQRPSYLASLLDTAKANKIALPDTVTDTEVQAWKDFFRDLVNNIPDKDTKLALSDEEVMGMAVYKYGATPDKKPAQARYDYADKLLHNPRYWDRLSPETRALLNSPETKKVIYKLVNDPITVDLMEKLWGGVKIKILFVKVRIGHERDETRVVNVRKTIGRMGPADVQFTLDMVRKGLSDQELHGVVASMDEMAKLGYFMSGGPNIAGI